MNDIRASACLIAGSLALILSGCEKKAPPPSAKQEDSVAQPAEARPTKRRVVAADPSKDAAETPAWLPKPQEIPGWTRTSNVDVYYPDQWNRLEDERLRNRLEAFLIKAVRTCEYTSAEPNPAGIVANVTIVEAHQADDAYGLFTNSVLARPETRVGSFSSFVASETEQKRNCWQGDYFVQAEMSVPAGTNTNAMLDKLVAGLVRPIPSKRPPALLGFLPPSRRIQSASGHTWFARKHLQTLPALVLRDALKGQGVLATKVLGLGADTLMVVTAFDPGEGEPPNVVWLVRYPTTEQAKKAYGAYKSALRKIRSAPQVLMQPPTGPYLCGTWTAAQESIMHILPEITARLPQAVSP